MNRTEQLVRQHAAALDTIDPEGVLAIDVAYTRGSFYYSIGDFAAAITAFDNIVRPEALARTTDSLLVTDVFIYLGNAYHRLQNYQRALDHYRIASKWLPQTAEDPNYDQEYRRALNALYQAQSLYTTAHYNHQPEAYALGKSLSEQALAYFLAQSNTPRFQNPIRSGANILASIYQDQQQYDSTLHYLSLALSTQRENSTLLITTYQEMGATYTLMKRYSKAQEAYDRSLQLANELLPAKHYQRASVYLHQGQLLAAQNDWQGGLEKYQQALGQLVTEFTAETDVLENPLYRDTGAKKELLEVLSYKAETLWGLYQQQPESTAPLQSALEIYHLIGDILDEMRQGFPSVEYRQFVASHFFKIYEQAIRVAYEMHQRQPTTDRFLAEAFHFIEKSKSFTLLEATQKIQAQSFGGVPDSLLEQERTYARKISILEQELNNFSDATSSEATQVQQQLLVAQRTRQDLLQQFEQNYPDYYALRHNTEVASLADVQASLPSKTVLLSYFMGDSSLFTMGISTDEVIIDSIASFRNFEQNLDNFLPLVRQYNLEAIQSPEAGLKWTESGHALYQQLVGNLLDSLDTQSEKLVIIPDGQLGYLPFDVLLGDV
ncbi:MAG: tetratricopeptide repeat protein [Bacteroidota bacterium]